MSKVFKVEATWLAGTQVESETREFKMLLDKPKEENGTDLGPKPSEVTLQALGGCLIFAYLYAANRLGVTIDGLKVKIEGDMVPGGWMDENNGKRTGFKNVRFAVEVKADHSREEIEKVHNLALKVSPMYDNFVNPIEVANSFSIL